MPALQLGLEAIWNEAWIPEEEAFFLRADAPAEPAPDLNLLIAPVYAWMFRATQDSWYRDRGDEVFAGGVKHAFLAGGKQFSQHYKWSFDYLRWRIQGEEAKPVILLEPKDLDVEEGGE